MTTKEVRRDIAGLKKDLDRLQGDLRQITRRGGSAARHVTSDAVESMKGAAAGVLEEGTDRMRSVMHDASDVVMERGHDVFESVKDQVEEKPVASALITMGVGFALGLFLARKL
ncbi:hypothetical protein BH23DEI1_BH23DEI1_24550 [soil metagenome]|nr:DUF883 family protein [Trueperaceae bacterium]